MAPSTDLWLKEAKEDINASKCGMYVFHNGVVRADARAMVRNGQDGLPSVTAMNFDYDAGKVASAEKNALSMPGIYYVRTWLNKGTLSVGDDIMLVLVGGDTRPHVLDCLSSLVGEIKSRCVIEEEVF